MLHHLAMRLLSASGLLITVPQTVIFLELDFTVKRVTRYSLAFFSALLLVPVSAVASGFTQGFTLSQSPSPDASDEKQPIAPNPPDASEVEGEVILQEEGTLSTGGPVLPDNTLYQEHTFEGTEGQAVNVLLESDDFDTYLLLVDSTGQVINFSDDISETDTNSELSAILPNDGEYLVIANAYAPNQEGEYTVTVKEIEADQVSEPAVPQQQMPQMPQSPQI
ncbi:MAG: hypothetical protein Kow00121_62480 [Elainellaceae cyanobacterium]